MKTKRAILVSVLGIMVILTAFFFIKIGWVITGEKDIDKKRMGYCFDVATSDDGSRLFVAAGDRGVHIFDLDQGRMKYATTYYDDGYYRNLKVLRDRAYVADSRRGLVVLDISGSFPRTTWTQSNSSGAAGLHLEDDKVYLAAYEEGLQIYDISNPDAPALLSTLSTGDYSWDVWVHNDFAYIADFNIGVSIADVSSPEAPQLIGSVTWTNRYPSAEILRGEGNTIYVAASDHGLVVIDVSNPRDPVIASSYRPIRIGNAEGLAVRDGVVYLAQGSKFEFKAGGEPIEFATTIDNGLHIIDTIDPYAPHLISKINFMGWVEGVHITGKYVYIANGFNGVRSIDVDDRANPSIIDSFLSLP
ncbi:MAG: hypothetical protein AMJ88_13300 [Anaerolineae bacterium SM23_ 63]|nr:MAG: hypothetical protein AMJ88_13300 [Anaerolineae bacterium SM23_ 63]HEY47998.1 hypothetical protein [Anaerolineae bacterium]